MASEGVPDFIPQTNLGLYKLSEDVIEPAFATAGSACFDLYCNFSSNSKIKAFTCSTGGSIELFPDFSNKDQSKWYVTIYTGLRVMIPTGIIFDIPKNHSVRLHNRSGLALKNGIKLVNQEAIIDSDYVEETFVLLENNSNVPYFLYNHTRVCQAELVTNLSVNFFTRVTRPTSETRVGGFGSTGVS